MFRYAYERVVKKDNKPVRIITSLISCSGLIHYVKTWPMVITGITGVGQKHGMLYVLVLYGLWPVGN